MEENEKMDSHDHGDIFSKAVRAGKRTYFFDVKSTKGNDYYLTITERKKHFEQDGHFHVEKHKIFLYKEDFEKFAEGLAEVVEFIKLSGKMPDKPFERHSYSKMDEEKTE